MTDQRSNWNSKAAEELADTKQVLLARLQTIRVEIQSCGNDFKRYDKLKEEQREVMAKLATMEE